MRKRPDILIVGAGDQARVVLDILDEMGVGREVAGFLDYVGNESLWGADLDGKLVLGGPELLDTLRTKGIRRVHVGVGDNAARKELVRRAIALGYDLVTAVHPKASVSRRARVSAGAAIHPGAVVMTGARIGQAAIVNTGACVDHDCVVGDYAHIAPGAHLAGRVRVGTGTMIGIGASVRQGTSIGEWATVGAGAAVVADLKGGKTYVGVPARELRKPRRSP